MRSDRKNIRLLRRGVALWLFLALLLTASPACAQRTAKIHGLSFSTDSEEIDLGDLKVTMKELTAFLDQFPNLRHVDMFGTKVKKEEIQQLVSRYPNVTFGWTIHIFGTGKGHDVRTDQTAFSTLHGECYPHSSEQLEVLKYCTELRALDLGHNRIQNLSFLSGLTKLRVLILSCNDITDISPLENLRELEYLELFSNRIKDITPLLNMPRLTDLNLVYNKVPNTDVLKQMPQLRRLWVSHCIKGLSGKPLLLELQSALPDTQIVVEGEPTQNGWRNHPHYDTIQRMFSKTHAYEPFDDMPWPEDDAD